MGPLTNVTRLIKVEVTLQQVHTRACRHVSGHDAGMGGAGFGTQRGRGGRLRACALGQ